jgi:hypothetical protein
MVRKPNRKGSDKFDIKVNISSTANTIAIMSPSFAPATKARLESFRPDTVTATAKVLMPRNDRSADRFADIRGS